MNLFNNIISNFVVLADIEGYPNVLALNQNTVFDMVVIFANVLVIVAILTWLLYKPVGKFLADRTQRIASEIAKAAENLQTATEKQSLYEGKLVAISGEREEILEAARKLASQREAEIVQEANSEARSIISRAQLEIEREKEKARDEMRTQIIQISTLMAEKLLGGGMDEDAKSRILNQAIAELGDATWEG